jgi:hypothetical protein
LINSIKKPPATAPQPQPLSTPPQAPKPPQPVKK